MEYTHIHLPSFLLFSCLSRSSDPTAGEEQRIVGVPNSGKLLRIKENLHKVYDFTATHEKFSSWNFRHATSIYMYVISLIFHEMLPSYWSAKFSPSKISHYMVCDWDHCTVENLSTARPPLLYRHILHTHTRTHGGPTTLSCPLAQSRKRICGSWAAPQCPPYRS